MHHPVHCLTFHKGNRQLDFKHIVFVLPDFEFLLIKGDDIDLLIWLVLLYISFMRDIHVIVQSTNSLIFIVAKLSFVLKYCYALFLWTFAFFSACLLCCHYKITFFISNTTLDLRPILFYSHISLFVPCLHDIYFLLFYFKPFCVLTFIKCFL